MLLVADAAADDPTSASGNDRCFWSPSCPKYLLSTSAGGGRCRPPAARPAAARHVDDGDLASRARIQPFTRYPYTMVILLQLVLHLHGLAPSCRRFFWAALRFLADHERTLAMLGCKVGVLFGAVFFDHRQPLASAKAARPSGERMTTVVQPSSAPIPPKAISANSASNPAVAAGGAPHELQVTQGTDLTSPDFK